MSAISWRVEGKCDCLHMKNKADIDIDNVYMHHCRKAATTKLVFIG